MKECSCRGGNPHCAMCGGLGSVKGQAPRLRFPTTKEVKVRVPVPLAPCPYCDELTKNLAQHISSNHPDKWEEFTSTIEGKKPLRCEKCFRVITSGRQKPLERHKERCRVVRAEQKAKKQNETSS